MVENWYPRGIEKGAFASAKIDVPRRKIRESDRYSQGWGNFVPLLSPLMMFWTRPCHIIHNALRASIQVKDAIESNVRFWGLLQRAARSGKTAVWKAVVEVVKAAERGLLKEVPSHGQNGGGLPALQRRCIGD